MVGVMSGQTTREMFGFPLDLKSQAMILMAVRIGMFKDPKAALRISTLLSGLSG